MSRLLVLLVGFAALAACDEERETYELDAVQFRRDTFEFAGPRSWHGNADGAFRIRTDATETLAVAIAEGCAGGRMHVQRGPAMPALLMRLSESLSALEGIPWGESKRFGCGCSDCWMDGLRL